jgi:enoyl-CoA hydratase/carnithine racemase
MLRALVGQRAARDILHAGDFYEPEEALRLGLVDAVRPADDVLDYSIRYARSLGSIPGEVYSQIKSNRVEPTRGEIETGVDSRDGDFINAWYSPATQEKLRQAEKKF